MTDLVLTFNDTELTAISRDGRVYISASDLGKALGYAQGYPQTDVPFNHSFRVNRLYERHFDEFAEDETTLITLQTPGGPQQARVFSPRGARLIAMFARTPKAKEFRRWVLDVLDNLDKLRTTAPDLYTLCIRPANIDELMAPTDLVETLATKLALSEAPTSLPTLNLRWAWAHKHWRDYISKINVILQALGIPVLHLAKLHDAARAACLPPIPAIIPNRYSLSNRRAIVG